MGLVTQWLISLNKDTEDDRRILSVKFLRMKNFGIYYFFNKFKVTKTSFSLMLQTSLKLLTINIAHRKKNLSKDLINILSDPCSFYPENVKITWLQ